MDTAKVIRDRIGNIITHAHGAGIMMRRAKIIPPIFKGAESCQSCGARVYLPKYSPDLNPIELPYSKFKAFERVH